MGDVERSLQSCLKVCSMSRNNRKFKKPSVLNPFPIFKLGRKKVGIELIQLPKSHNGKSKLHYIN